MDGKVQRWVKVYGGCCDWDVFVHSISPGVELKLCRDYPAVIEPRWILARALYTVIQRQPMKEKICLIIFSFSFCRMNVKHDVGQCKKDYVVMLD